MKPLPPYGRAHLAHVGSSGVWVAVGSDAWDFPARKTFPVMVLPPGADPDGYIWPVDGESVLMVQTGTASPTELGRAALALLRCGAVLVVAVIPGRPEGPIHYYPEVRHEAA